MAQSLFPLEVPPLGCPVMTLMPRGGFTSSEELTPCKPERLTVEFIWGLLTGPYPIDGVPGIPGEPTAQLMTGKGEPRLPRGEFTEEVIADPIMEGCKGAPGGGVSLNGRPKGGLREEVSGL